MVNHVNENEYGHVLTIEDPIEFLHESKKCLINQRELGRTPVVPQRAARRRCARTRTTSCIGEMRDLETIRLALTAAETGHLVFGTLHTSSAGQDDRPDHRRVPRGREGHGARDAVGVARVGDLADLLKTEGRAGRVAAHEIMIGTPAIRNLIRENKVAQMYSSIQTSQSVGMQTLDQCLTRARPAQHREHRRARQRAVNKDLFGGA
jgi:twitching motility protein PilT